MYLVSALEVRITRNTIRLKNAGKGASMAVIEHLGGNATNVKEGVMAARIPVIPLAVHQHADTAMELLSQSYCAWLSRGIAGLLEIRFGIFPIHEGVVALNPTKTTPWLELCTDAQLKNFSFSE